MSIQVLVFSLAILSGTQGLRLEEGAKTQTKPDGTLKPGEEVEVPYLVAMQQLRSQQKAEETLAAKSRAAEPEESDFADRLAGEDCNDRDVTSGGCTPTGGAAVAQCLNKNSWGGGAATLSYYYNVMNYAVNKLGMNNDFVYLIEWIQTKECCENPTTKPCEMVPDGQSVGWTNETFVDRNGQTLDYDGKFEMCNGTYMNWVGTDSRFTQGYIEKCTLKDLCSCQKLTDSGETACNKEKNCVFFCDTCYNAMVLDGTDAAKTKGKLLECSDMQSSYGSPACSFAMNGKGPLDMTKWGVVGKSVRQLIANLPAQGIRLKADKNSPGNRIARFLR